MSTGVSPTVNRAVNVIVCVGAAVVIFGAMGKILHLSWADMALKVGLSTEALIFLVYAILPPPDMGPAYAPPAETGNPALKQLDKMLQEAEITPANLTKLSNSFQKLGTTVDSMGEVSDVIKSTTDFSLKAKEATVAFSALKDASHGATHSLNGFHGSAETATSFHNQMQGLNKNLASLNAIYELELKESNNHLKALNQFYGNLSQASQAMSGTAEDALKAKEQIAALANNLGKLNQVYGSMLTAMQGRA
ncbi:MAG: gliding motility protein GldL [Bacteroidetes bacterium]|nr:gliding motility protein GldL [Bacteroidota bacterium]